MEYCSKDPQSHDPREKSHWKASGNRSSSNSSSSLFVIMRRVVQGNLSRNPELLVDTNPKFEIDLRIEGVSQDAILQDEVKMNEINKKLEV